MTCNTPKTHRRSPSPNSADIVTYRYNEKLVYVPVAHDYIQALAHARVAFPQLSKLSDASLSLSLTSPGQEHKLVGISAPAWPKLVAHMSRFQVIDVRAAPVSIPVITITYADAEDHACMTETEPELPPYRGPDIVVDEKAPRPRPRTLSTTSCPGRRNWFFQKRHANAP